MIIIYPNNDALIDGEAAFWTPADFARHKIPMERLAPTSFQDKAAHTTIDGKRALVFPTGFLNKAQHGRRILPVADRYGSRPHEMRDGVLFLRCSTTTGCGHWLPSDQFAKNCYRADRWLNTCRSCVNTKAQSAAASRSRTKIAMMIHIQERMKQQTESDTTNQYQETRPCHAASVTSSTQPATS